MMDTDINLYKSIVINTFKGLAAKGSDQVEFYPEYILASEELALTFDSSLPLIRALVSEKAIDDQILSLVNSIDSLLIRLSNEEAVDFWEDNGLLKDERWDIIRESAEKVLVKLGVNVDEEPPFDHSLS